MYFGRKHVENEPSCLHELNTFLKYYMPLRSFFYFRLNNCPHFYFTESPFTIILMLANRNLHVTEKTI